MNLHNVGTAALKCYKSPPFGQIQYLNINVHNSSANYRSGAKNVPFTALRRFNCIT